MAKRRGRKVTPTLIADSHQALIALVHLTRMLRAWHPGAMPLAIIEQQLDAFSRELHSTEKSEG
jgi:hypothetical protein